MRKRLYYNVLIDKDTKEIVSSTCIFGKYGKVWVIDGKTFVGVAKRPETYHRKGYDVKTVEVEVEFNGKESEVIDEQIVNCNMQDYQDPNTRVHRLIYFAKSKDFNHREIRNVRHI